MGGKGALDGVQIGQTRSPRLFSCFFEEGEAKAKIG